MNQETFDVADFLRRFKVANAGAVERDAREVPRLNVFSILGLQGKEQPANRFLAWLLGAHASHEQGNIFFRSVLELIGLPPETMEEYAGTDYTVRTEYPNRVDISILVPKLFVMFLEIKIGAGEQKNQLDRYANYLREQFADIAPVHRHLVYVNIGAYPAQTLADESQSSDFQFHVLDFSTLADQLLMTATTACKSEYVSRLVFDFNYSMRLAAIEKGKRA